MALNINNTKKFNNILENTIKLADSLNKYFENDIAIVQDEEGTEKDPTGIVFLDIPSFVSMYKEEKELLETIVHEADAVNIFVLPEAWIRIAFAVLNCWDREKDPYETDVVDMFSSKK